jgi:hypothetical protein
MEPAALERSCPEPASKSVIDLSGCGPADVAAARALAAVKAVMRGWVQHAHLAAAKAFDSERGHLICEIGASQRPATLERVRALPNAASDTGPGTRKAPLCR